MARLQVTLAQICEIFGKLSEQFEFDHSCKFRNVRFQKNLIGKFLKDGKSRK